MGNTIIWLNGFCVGLFGTALVACFFGKPPRATLILFGVALVLSFYLVIVNP